jgi:translation initiation factor 1
MPFTIGGDWIPEPIANINKQQVKVIKEKRRGAFVTLILHLSQDQTELKKTCSVLKQRLACGGSVKDGQIELQGDKVEPVKKYLTEIGIKIR